MFAGRPYIHCTVGVWVWHMFTFYIFDHKKCNIITVGMKYISNKEIIKN